MRAFVILILLVGAFVGGLYLQHEGIVDFYDIAGLIDKISQHEDDNVSVDEALDRPANPAPSIAEEAEEVVTEEPAYRPLGDYLKEGKESTDRR